MRFGASVWPWRWDAPYDTGITRIADAGFRATELIAWNRTVLDEYYTPATIASLRKLLAGRDMVLSQFIVDNRGMASADPAVRGPAVDMFKKGVEVAAELGAGIINTVTHLPFEIQFPFITDRPHMQTFSQPVPSDLDWKRNYEEYVQTLIECCEHAGAAGLKYSLEPHPFRYGANIEGLLRLIEAVDSPVLGVNLDPSHLFPVGDLPHIAVYRLAPHVLHCHFSDNDGETNVHWRPGMGKINWAHLMQALKDTGFDGVISLEFEDVPGVSRGVEDVPGVYKGNADATDEFVGEYETALAFLTGLAEKVGLKVE
ncbi:sugar phosphate isomerase/epimerase family protein [Amycolatopsis saalfeldensis]|uniref:Sugar phosphate isomerase/epimerase n=1 Tax=Amycolatopsis saalfeldensis TaxID=394193 RepID=A0A1H8XXI1_9PSEU|nr:sugar phosphate isomerase/epimerase family protein [Amycolatopsis saalfeldensis]SEP44507.1 Sugar phosphate isomerase/epimerase [Amycolatopsis saalfeldensis]